jgi:hypothetical protein
MLDANHGAFKLISCAQSHAGDATVLKHRLLQSQLRFVQVRAEPGIRDSLDRETFIDSHA